MIGVVGNLLAPSFVLLVPLDTLVVDVVLLAASVSHLLLRLRKETLKLLINSLTLKLILSLDFQSHLELKIFLLLVCAKLPKLKLSALLEVHLHLLKLAFKLDNLLFHVSFSNIKVSDASSVLIFDLSSVG